jgi:hypothetical protein
VRHARDRVRPNAGVGWVELANSGTSAADVSGGIVTDNDDTHVDPIAANTSIGGGGFLALEVDPTFGLGASDSARVSSRPCADRRRNRASRHVRRGACLPPAEARTNVGRAVVISG